MGTIGFTAPTGHYGVPLFGLVPGSNLGQGFWAIQGNLLAVNRYDPVIVYYGVGYRHLFARDFAGIPFAAGEQLSYQMGVGFSVNDRVTLSTTFLGYYLTDSFQNNQKIAGSNLEPLACGSRPRSPRDRILEPFAIIGMTEFAGRVGRNYGDVLLSGRLHSKWTVSRSDEHAIESELRARGVASCRRFLTDLIGAVGDSPWRRLAVASRPAPAGGPEPAGADPHGGLAHPQK